LAESQVGESGEDLIGIETHERIMPDHVLGEPGSEREVCCLDFVGLLSTLYELL